MLMYDERKEVDKKEVDEAGRKYMAQYYVDNPAEFTLLLQNMFEYRAQRFSKEYNERRARFEKNLKFVKSTDVFGKQGGEPSVYEFGYHCQ